MGFLKSLFGIGSSTHEKLSLTDNDLGIFTALNNSGNRIIWHGFTDFLGEKISLFIHGEQNKLDDSQKKSILEILKDGEKVEIEIDKSLRDQYENADKEYTTWKAYFKCISISSSEQYINVTMEEKDSFHHFNIFFIDNKSVDVAIDT